MPTTPRLLILAALMLAGPYAFAQADLSDIFARKDTTYNANNKLKVNIEPGKSDTVRTGGESSKVTEMVIPLVTPQEAAADAAQRVIKAADS